MNLYNEFIDLVGISPNDNLIGFVFVSLLSFWLIYNIFGVLYTLFKR